MTERVGKAFVLQPDEGRAIDLGGFSVTVTMRTTREYRQPLLMRRRA